MSIYLIKAVSRMIQNSYEFISSKSTLNPNANLLSPLTVCGRVCIYVTGSSSSSPTTSLNLRRFTTYRHFNSAAQMPAPMPMANMPPPALPPRCPHCGSTAPPIFRKNRWKQWCCCVILLFTLPFVSWAPFCVDSCADREMYCPQCLRVRKSYNPIMQTEAVFM